MGPKTRDIKFTYEDYLVFPDDRRRHELIDGEHYMTPSPSIKHQQTSVNLSTALKVFLKEKKVGMVYSAPSDVVLSDLDVVQPDLLFISSHRSSIITEKCIQGAPDLIVEIISENTRKTDEVIKRKLYERYGVQEYWIVDPELETVKVFRVTEEGFIRSAELSKEENDILTSPLLPDLKIPLTEIFE